MKGKSYSIPLGMVFRKHYCAKCGAKLEKERTHRVVNKNDTDYYQYQELGSFPRWDYDVYEYRFKCPDCGARASYEEQRILRKIQKRCGHGARSPDEIKDNYKDCKKRVKRSALWISCVVAAVLYAIIGAIAFFQLTEHGQADLLICLAGFALATAITVFFKVRKYKGKYDARLIGRYSYEQESLYKKLHTYSVHNKKMVEESENCHCYYCQSTVDSGSVESYADDGETALCPRCGINALIPDSVDEKIDANVLHDMHEYWF